MEVEFELTLDDLLAFNQYHTNRSPAIRGQLLRGRLAFPIVFATEAEFHALVETAKRYQREAPV